jgi:hypothetical protein
MGDAAILDRALPGNAGRGGPPVQNCCLYEPVKNGTGSALGDWSSGGVYVKLFCPKFLKASHKAMKYLSGIEVPDEVAEKCLKELSCRRIRHHPPLLPGNPPINRLSHMGLVVGSTWRCHFSLQIQNARRSPLNPSPNNSSRCDNQRTAGGGGRSQK